MENRGDEIYKFRAKIDNLRQLIKYPSGTLFIDKYGKLFKYKKGKKQYSVVCRNILKREQVPEGVVLHIEEVPSPHIIYYSTLADNIKYASVMLTDYGPLVYDYTAEKHEPYRRSI